MQLSRRALAALALVLAVAAGGPAGARPYETFIAIESEEDIYDLFAENQIDEDTFQTLVSLYQRGVDLTEATRQELYSLPNLTYDDVDAIIAYREEAGTIADPAALVRVGALSPDKLLAIAPFLVVPGSLRPSYAVDGWLRAQTRWSVEDAEVPPLAFQTRLSTMKHLTVGVAAVVTRHRLGDVVYDPNRNGLIADAPGTDVHVPKAFVEWADDDLHLIAGTYRVGFGQRLTFDNTDQYTPNGIYRDDEIFRDTGLTRRCKESTGELAASPCAGADGRVYVTPDYRWREGLLGAAAGVRTAVGPGVLQAYGFASHQGRSIYQYALYDRALCEDPRVDSDACRAPDVYRRPDGDLLAPTSEFSYRTLPNLYRESLFGANVTYAPARRVQFGITGYGARVDWLATGIDLDFQEWARTPFGGPYGALGVDVAWGHRWADLFFEASHSYDSMDGGGGGPAALARGVATWNKNEVEASLRYYDQHYANPYAGPISQPDQFEGLRARDEAGARVRYAGRLKKRLHLRALADLWVQPSTEELKTQLYLRADVDATRRLRLGLWTQFDDKNLGSGPVAECQTRAELQLDPDADPTCASRRVQLIGRARYVLHPRWSLAGQLDGKALEDERYTDRLRNDVSAWAILTGRPADQFRLRARARYLFQAIDDDTYGEQSLWLYTDLGYRLGARDRLRFRYDLFYWLDDRSSTADRVPNPEHWLWLEYETRY